MDTLIANYDIKNVSTHSGTSGWTLVWTTTGGGIVTEHGTRFEDIVKALDTATGLNGSDFQIILGDDVEVPSD